MILPNESGNNMQGGGGGVERELLQTISSKIQQLIKNDNLVYAYRTLVLSYLAFPFSEFYFTPMSILIHSDWELGHMMQQLRLNINKTKELAVDHNALIMNSTANKLHFSMCSGFTHAGSTDDRYEQRHKICVIDSVSVQIRRGHNLHFCS